MQDALWRGYSIKQQGTDTYNVYNCDGDKVHTAGYDGCIEWINSQYGDVLKPRKSFKEPVLTVTPSRTTPISQDDVTDLRIALETMTIDDIIKGA